MTDSLLDLRHAIQTFLEEKLHGDVTDSGMFVQGPREAHIEVDFGSEKYQITIEEL